MSRHFLDTRNPRAITLVPVAPPIAVWVTDPQGDAPDARGAGQESLVLWSPGWPEPRALVAGADAIGAPAAASCPDGAVIACPVCRDGGGARLEIFSVDGGGLTEQIPLDDASSSTPGRVSLCSLGQEVLACWAAWSGGAVSLDAAVIAPGRGASCARGRGLLRDVPGLARSPRLAWDGERPWLAWLRSPRRGAPWEISLRSLDRSAPDLAVARTRRGSLGGLDLAAAGPGVLWIAWHSDRRPGRGRDRSRWIEVRAVTGRRLLSPRGVPLRRRWGDLGEDQGLEFPVLIPMHEGGLVLLARSAHRHWRFDLDGRGWSAPAALDEPGWGCRARRPGAIRVPGSSQVFAAWRRRQGVVLESLDPVRVRRAPRLAPVGVALGPLRASPRSWPRRASPGPGGWRLCFGDIHQHTAHSDGTGSAREAYERARDEYRDDLAAVTDHESFLGKRIGAGEWRELLAECDLHDEPGRFVTLPGYEWTGARHPGPGHRCVYWPCSDRPLLGREHVEARTSSDLVAAVGRRGGLVFPHHVGWTGADAAAHDPAVQTCWEIVSCHGAYEAIDVGPIGQRDVPLAGQFLRDQLEAGLRFGFVGGSDGHGLLWHHGVSRKRDSHRTGLTAVLVKELSRPAVFEALRLRRCYATSGVPIALSLSVDGAPMGAEVRPGATVHVEAFADGLSPLRRAELVGSGGTSTPLHFTGSTLRAVTDVPALRTGTTGYLYLRVEQCDAEVAWSSPVWLAG
jgi:hypothetical protein